MDRRRFLRAGGAWAVALISGVVRGGSALAAPAVYSDDFARAATSRGWGKPWFNQRRGLKWGISKGSAFLELPEPQIGAGRHNPNPVLLLDNDATDVDLRGRIRSSNKNIRFGLVARVVGYGDYYAVYLEGSEVRISKFGLGREKELKKATFAVRSGLNYSFRLKITGADPVQIKAKVWPVSRKEPGGWTLSARELITEAPITRAGAAGFLFIHDDVTHKPGRLTVDNFALTSSQRRRNSTPEITFAFAGRVQQVSSGLRAQVVAKTDIPSTVVFEVASDPAFRAPSTVVPNSVDTRAQVAKAFLTGLSPSTTVYWRAVATSKSGRKVRGRARVLPTPPNPGEEIRFCFGSCSKSFATSTSFKRAAALDPWFFAHLGDLGYPESALSGGGAMALTTGSFQDRWTRMLGPRSATELHRKAAWIMIQDDHDYGRDNSWSETVRPFTIGAFDAMSGNLDERFFDIRYGDVHAFFLDTRIHADNPATPDGPEHSLLGGTQKSWLTSAMRDSNAPLKVVFSSQPFWGGGQGLFSWKEAFASERVELLDFFRSQQGTGNRVIICSGNAHAHYINRHSAPGEKDVIEFVSSGMDRRETSGIRQLPDDGVIDPQRNVKSRDGFAFVQLKTAGNNQRVEMRCLDSSTGVDVWPPLNVDL